MNIKQMKAGQYFALIVGVMYVLVGIMGFIPALVQQPASSAAVSEYANDVGQVTSLGFGYLMGIFPINILHNIVHLTVGALGILASISLGSSRLYSGALAIFYGLLTVLGLIPYTNTMFGLVPIFGNDVWLHAVTAAIAFYFGFIAMPDLNQMASDREMATDR